MTLAWDRFEQLSGAAERNFEILIRALVRRRWGRFGQLRDRLNQPGVEFHLELKADCDLGDAGRWFGWQCRFYKKLRNNQLGSERRKKIKAAVLKAREDVPGLTDFVLCLPQLPSAADLRWFDQDLQNEAPKGLTLHRWGPDDIEAQIEDGAAVLRASFFGELIFTPEALASCHEQSVAPIRQRWVPDLHVITHVEERLREGLFRSDGLGRVRSRATVLAGLADDLSVSESALSTDQRAPLRRIVEDVRGMSAAMFDLVRSIESKRPEAAGDVLSTISTPRLSLRETRDVLRRVRSLPCLAALAASTVEADVRRSLEVVADVRSRADSPLIAVVGGAGSGKSHLGAQLTAPSDGSVAGVFIRGVELSRGGTLDDLAGRVPALAVSSFADLLAGCDAAGGRNGQRVPIVIDGLNESHRPEDWPDLVARLVPTLADYPNVRLVLTYRGALADSLRSDAIEEINLELSEPEVSRAVQRYFEYFKIAPGDVRLPYGLFREMLFLRLYCEASNYDRHDWVGAEALPQSLVAVFEKYVADTADRLSSRPGHPTFPPGHVERKLAQLAIRLWELDARDLQWDEAKLLIDGDSHSWDGSLLRALEEEGVLARDDTAGLNQRSTAFLFDRLGGYLVAEALISRSGHREVRIELAENLVWSRLVGDRRHPLAEDIRLSFVGLLPRRGHGQLWTLAPEEYRELATLETLGLESQYLDEATLAALADVIPRRPVFSTRHPFDRLWELRDVVGHRLSAGFIDRILRPLSLTARDVVWTEWVRQRSDQLGTSVERHRRDWERRDRRGEEDALAGLAIAWLLTTTDIELRDRSTRALQRMAGGEPAAGFELATGLLDVNDVYVVERVVAAAYGGAMSRQMPEPGGPFERALRSWLNALRRAYLARDARCPSSHALLRTYVRGCFEFAARLHPAAVPDDVDPESLDFVRPAAPKKLAKTSKKYKEVDRSLQMDFVNYTVGGLYDERANYDMQHRPYLEGLGEIASRIWELGWRAETFDAIDKELAAGRWRAQGPKKVERYGKKYGLIAYYELAGRLLDAGKIPQTTWGRPRDGVWPDVDPTFTPQPERLDLALTQWAGAGGADPATWVRDGVIDLPEELLLPERVNQQTGPWILVEGFLGNKDPVRGRYAFGFFHTLLVAANESESLVELLAKQEYLGNNFVDRIPETSGVFAGEIPWSERFVAESYDDGRSVYDRAIGGGWDEEGLPVEIVAHRFSLSADRTETVEVGGFAVPSQRVAVKLDLRQRPRSLDMVELDGGLGSVTVSPPLGFEGHLLYVKADILARYAGDRVLVQTAWGERECRFDEYWDLPHWYTSIVRTHGNLWRRIAAGPARRLEEAPLLPVAEPQQD